MIRLIVMCGHCSIRLSIEYPRESVEAVNYGARVQMACPACGAIPQIEVFIVG